MMSRGRRSGNVGKFLLFAAPSTIVFVLVMIVPFFFGLFMTFSNWDGLSESFSLVGLENYRAVIDDYQFWQSFVLTLLYVFFTVILINVVAFFLAYILTSGAPGQNFFKSGFFTPNLIGGIVLGFVWQFLFATVLPALGQKLGWDFLTISWLSNPETALAALVVVTVWQYSGYMMVIYIAGFMAIPKELFEAASIEGANLFHRIKSIVVPLMVPSFIVCFFLSIQRGFMVYDINLSLTKGGPYGSTQLVSMDVYQTAFLSQQYGAGQAKAFLLFLFVAAASLTQVYFGKKKEVEL